MDGRAAITRSGRYSRVCVCVCVCVCVTAVYEVPGFLVGLLAEFPYSISRRGAHWPLCDERTAKSIKYRSEDMGS
ncbi:hypothetical protein CGRA01v4_01065 [Colletotrichum graminicola]|nr:hypothetical protein CGRA01v4_01065 [Colletotrichum graminicola]